MTEKWNIRVQLPAIPVFTASSRISAIFYKLVLLKTNFIYSTLRYTLLIEDDALPVPAFDLLMRSVVDRMDNDQRLDFIKLYHPGHLRKIPYYFQVIWRSTDKSSEIWRGGKGLVMNENQKSTSRVPNISELKSFNVILQGLCLSPI